MMFGRSINNGVKYRNYIGDGDSKTYTGVLNSKPYGDNLRPSPYAAGIDDSV